MIHKDYILDGSDAYYFSTSEWAGLVIVGIVAASISIFCNILVITLQSLMLYFRRTTTTRITLRLITVACFCNMTYCCLEISAIAIESVNSACRPIIFLITTFDTMTSMALSMVGLNLVLLFIFKIYKSVKAEIAYYVIVLLSGVFVSIIPLGVGHMKTESNIPGATCWYHFYFEDRVENIFNWTWYYGWLMLSLVFATACAILSIRYVVKNQRNLAGVLNMFAQREREEVVNAQGFRRYNPSNSNVFLKIARRCVCYPLVPLFSKIWGVAIAIASAKDRDIPFSVFIVDRAFTCLFGFMVACIYFSDPAIKNVMRETVNSIKQTYVYDYYSIKYQPGLSPDGSVIDEKYLQTLQIISLDKNSTEPAAEYITNIKQYNIEEQQKSSSDTSQSDSHLHHPLEISENHTTIPISEPPRVELEVIGGERVGLSSQAQQKRCCSVMALTSADGKTVIPKELISEAPKRRLSAFSLSKHTVSTVPMKRLSRIAAPNFIVEKQTSSIPEESYTFHAEFVDTMVAFKHPKVAKFIHWCMTSIFRVNPERHEIGSHALNDGNQQHKRVFRDFTDSSNPQTPTLDACSRISLDVAEGSKKVESKPIISDESLREITALNETSDSPVKSKSITIDDNLPTSSGSPEKVPSAVSINIDPVVKRPSHHRSLSINVASLNREKVKLDSPSASTKSKTSLTTTQKIASSFGLRKLLDKSLALSTVLAKPSSSSQYSIDCIERENDQVNNEEDEVKEESVNTQNQSTESIPIQKPVKALLTTDEFEFPVELSPRPLTQYQNLTSKPNTTENDGALETTRANKIKSTDDHDTLSFGIRSKLKTKPKDSIPMKYTTTPDDSSFKNICTSLNYISNWQLNDSKDRIGDTHEHWDLEQQLQEQTINSKPENQL